MPQPRTALIAARGGRTQEAICAAIRRMATEQGEPEPGINADRLRKWERGKERPSSYYVEKLCALYGKEPAELDLDSTTLAVPELPELVTGIDAIIEAAELVRQAEVSEVGTGTVQIVEETTERYCRAYGKSQPGPLLAEVLRFRQYVRQLLAARITLAQRRDLTVAAAWLSLLLACLEWDAGDRAAAAASRTATLALARQAGHDELAAWAYEVLAWWAVVDGRYEQATDLAGAGLALAAEGTSARVQLSVQKARAWSYMRKRREALHALAEAQQSLARTPDPLYPDNHFVFDPPKLIFYTATITAHVGEPQLAEEHAREVIVQSIGPDGKDRWPSRTSVACFDLGLAYIGQNKPDEAAAAGGQGLQTPRLSVSTWWRGAELDEALRERYGDLPETQDFHEQLLVALP